MFSNMGRIYQNRRVQRLDVYYGIMKMVINVLGKNSTEKHNKSKTGQYRTPKDLLKTSSSQRHSNYYGFVKSRAAARTLMLTILTSPLQREIEALRVDFRSPGKSKLCFTTYFRGSVGAWTVKTWSLELGLKKTRKSDVQTMR